MTNFDQIKSYSISKKGLELKSEIKKLARKNEIKIEFSGISSLFNFNVVSKYNRNYNQIITSEMIKFKIFKSSATIYGAPFQNGAS